MIMINVKVKYCSSFVFISTLVMAWWLERPPHDREGRGFEPRSGSYQRLKKWYLYLPPSCQTLGIQEWRREVEHA